MRHGRWPAPLEARFAGSTLQGMGAIALGTAAAAQGAVAASPPTNAIVLFDGSNLDAWSDAGDAPARWRIEGGYVAVEPGRGDILTRRSFSDFQLHLEFWLPEMP